MPAVASIDGAIASLAHARVPVTDRGLLFGDHVFEIARVEADVVIDGARHLDRLARSAALCQLGAPPRARIDAELAAAIAAAAEPRAVVRVIWTAGDGTTVRRADGRPGRAVIIVEPWQPTPGPGVRLCSVAVDAGGRTGALVPAAAKSGSYLASVLALETARAAGADDALLVDAADHALETATSNLAIVEAGQVTFAAGVALAGVTQVRLAELLAAAGIAVAHAPLARPRVAAADEVFVTSSRRGVTPVVAIDGVARPAGPTTGRARDHYDAWIAAVATAAHAAPPAL